MRRFFLKLKTTLLFKILENNYFILTFIIVLWLLVLNKQNSLLLIFLICYLIFVFIKNKRFFYVCLIFISLISINYLTRYYIRKSYDISYFEGSGKILKIDQSEDNFKYIIKTKKGKYLFYSKDCLKIGGKYYFKTSIKKPFKNHFPNGFNYGEYLFNKGIVGIFEDEDYQFIKQSFSIYYPNYISNAYIDKIIKVDSSILKALTIGNKSDIPEEINNSISFIGISHLFVISGLHVQLIVLLIIKICSLFKFKDKYVNIIIISCLISYFIICGYMISILRVNISYILRLINNKYNLKLKSKDIISINALFVLFLNPYYLFQSSFSLSYIIATSIIICSKIIKTKTKRFKTLISAVKISILATLITLPIVSVISPTINLLSVIYNIFFIPFVSYILLPVSILTLVFPFIQNIYGYVIYVFENIIMFLSKIDIFCVDFPSIPWIFYLVYYSCLYLVLCGIDSLKNKTNKRLIVYSSIYICFIIVWVNAGIFRVNPKVYFLDLPVGEATLISDSNYKILIDTGEVGSEDLIVFLKKLGIKKLDVIMITHSDSDHYGMLPDIINEFKVGVVVCSEFDNSNYYKNIKKVRSGDFIKLKNITFSFLSPSVCSTSKNNNSLVMVCNFYNKKILFTGDIEKEIESTLPDIGYVDVLKVPHHGSSTSSGALLEKVSFDVAICMNGYRNSFSFPTNLIRKRYKEKLLVTSETGTYVLSI